MHEELAGQEEVAQGWHCTVLTLLSRWLKAGTVLRALQRLASLAGRTGTRRKESNYDRLQEVLNNLDRM